MKTTAIYDFFTEDHNRLDDLLKRATANINNIDMDLYQEFRVGLLTHISWEEKVLFKLAQEANNGEPLELQRELRVEHGAITSLMVPPPNADIIKVLKHALDVHDEKEEKEGGMYEACEKLTAEQTEEILETLRNFPVVPVHPHRDIPLAWEAAKRACARAGWDYDAIVKS